MKKKWRGIQTTQKRKNELKAKTIINRLGQKSISLPRIDDRKRWAGYPGIAGISKEIADLVPLCKYYVEPFAGTAKVYQELPVITKQMIKKLRGKIILNDTSKFIRDWLRAAFFTDPLVKVTRNDFVKCMKRYDGKTTFFLIDLPWFKSYYDQGFSSFNRESVKQYSKEVIDFCNVCEGKFIITTRKENQVMLRSMWPNYHIKSKYVVCGKYPEVLITTNLRGLK